MSYKTKHEVVIKGAVPFTANDEVGYQTNSNVLASVKTIICAVTDFCFKFAPSEKVTLDLDLLLESDCQETVSFAPYMKGTAVEAAAHHFAVQSTTVELLKDHPGDYESWFCLYAADLFITIVLPDGKTLWVVGDTTLSAGILYKLGDTPFVPLESFMLSELANYCHEKSKPRQALEAFEDDKRVIIITQPISIELKPHVLRPEPNNFTDLLYSKAGV
ncbi:hypothetical protein [Vibrio phage vB_VmeM-Yong XC32]|nr:hypothetical protein [Vibrio phage vB_VmeM-Yong XC31]QAX96498.1 hypothetical protein [Vibrio phage vB_VmeM-Yong XC32]QAX96815.1 hypothetical protein [Vibrio phage vB_VmeM-Yong MS31]QAX97134.1 hypothetical protein [Vibrio phage vB_VmeM-Yong MS32]